MSRPGSQYLLEAETSLCGSKTVWILNYGPPVDIWARRCLWQGRVCLVSVWSTPRGLGFEPRNLASHSCYSRSRYRLTASPQDQTLQRRSSSASLDRPPRRSWASEIAWAFQLQVYFPCGKSMSPDGKAISRGTTCPSYFNIAPVFPPCSPWGLIKKIYVDCRQYNCAKFLKFLSRRPKIFERINLI